MLSTPFRKNLSSSIYSCPGADLAASRLPWWRPGRPGADLAALRLPWWRPGRPGADLAALRLPWWRPGRPDADLAALRLFYPPEIEVRNLFAVLELAGSKQCGSCPDEI
jgi:hypothetical protein